MVQSTPYPQAPALTDAELRAFLNDAPVARLATHNPDGSIHVAPMYFRYDEPDLVLGTQAITQKVRNIERDPRVTVTVDVSDPHLIGVVMYGNAGLDRGDVVATRAWIFSRYRPQHAAEEFAHLLAAKWDQILIRVHPESVVSFDYRKGFPL